MVSTCMEDSIHRKMVKLDFWCVCVDALHPSQQFSSQVGTISCLPGLNQHCDTEKKVSYLRIQHSGSDESGTSDPASKHQLFLFDF